MAKDLLQAEQAEREYMEKNQAVKEERSSADTAEEKFVADVTRQTETVKADLASAINRVEAFGPVSTLSMSQTNSYLKAVAALGFAKAAVENNKNWVESLPLFSISGALGKVKKETLTSLYETSCAGKLSTAGAITHVLGETSIPGNIRVQVVLSFYESTKKK